MSLERKIRRNLRQQQRKALLKYMRKKEQERMRLSKTTGPIVYPMTGKTVSGFEGKVTRLDNPDSQGQTETNA